MRQKAAKFIFSSSRVVRSTPQLLAIFTLIACLLIQGSIQGCSRSATGERRAAQVLHSPLTVEVSPSFEAWKANSVLFVPLSVRYGDQIELADFDTSPLSDQLTQSFELATNLEVHTLKDRPLLKQQANPVESVVRKQACESGVKAGTQAVMFGIIEKFHDSNGTALGATSPSHVSFQLWLADVRDCSIRWHATFNHRDKPLTENLFGLSDTIRSGGVFQSAEAIAKDGFLRAAQQFEKLRAQPKA